MAMDSLELETDTQDHRAAHQQVLTLLRAGALEQAEKEYLRLALDLVQGDEDILALGGRILKSKALESCGQRRILWALEAGAKYNSAYTATGGTYSGINTAALYLVGGKIDVAKALATEILTKLQSQRPRPGEEAYYHMATTAEAYLILGDRLKAQECLKDAIQLDPHNFPAHATTLNQFEMILLALEAENNWLDALRPPAAVHYAGHIFGLPGGAQALDSAHRYALDYTVQEALRAENIGFAYGALAAGSDIIIAEAMLENGTLLHLVLPCPDDLFIETSVAPYGASWVDRFHTCKAQATSVRYVSRDIDVTDNLRTAFASELAMGLASLHAQTLATEAIQLLVWDGTPSDAPAGTARDAKLWSQSGRRQHVVPYPVKREKPTPDLGPDLKPGLGDDVEGAQRGLKAMLFADVRGFGALSDSMVPVFLDKVLTPLAATLEPFGKKIQHLNTWGDGLFVVFSDIEDAAAAAIEMQQCFHDFNLEAEGLPGFLALRIGGHYGPVHVKKDPFLKEMGVFGNEVSYAARIEPLAVPGSIYVSEAFACALAVNSSNKYRSESVGKMKPRKGSEAIKLFNLRKI
jgi:class 3 adenylate cyclase/tetratricopeptide (TPR) repeat protein